jgi:protein-S-isoprenylcysteine O-methyltransferase Ste14
MAMNLINLSRAGLGVATAGVIILVFRESLLAFGVMAIGVQVASTLLMLWARLSLGRRSFHAAADATEGGLVTWGPYRYLRHPIYAAVLYFLWAGVLTHLSIINGLSGALVTVGLAVRMRAEERLVAERYPEYAVYAAHTKRIVPFIF